MPPCKELRTLFGWRGRTALRSGDWGEHLLHEHRSFIEEDSVRLAFNHLVGHADVLQGFDCEARMQGAIRVFRYTDRSTKRIPYGFIVNRKSLLFYVRRPGLSALAYSKNHLLSTMPGSSENASGELTVRLASSEDVQRLLAYVFHEPDPRTQVPTPLHAHAMTKINVPAAKVKQGDLTLYTTSIKVKNLIVPGFYSVETLDPENANDKGFQRLLNSARAKRLADYIAEGQDTRDAFLPTSVFLATHKSIPYDEERHSISIDIDAVGPFSVVDGQHRLEGLRLAAAKDARVLDFDVPVNIAENLPKLAQMCHFLIVNTTQKSVDKSVEQRIIARLTSAIEVEDMPTLPRWIRKLVEVGDVEQAVRMVDFLNQSEESPWRNKVAMANADRDGATINQKSFVKAVVKYVLTANNPLTAMRDFEKEKKVFLNYWKAIALLLDDGNAAVLYKYNGVELFCKFSIPFFMKLQDRGSFTVKAQTDLMRSCLENVEGDYAGVGHPDWWASGSKASFLNAGAINIVAGAMGTSLNRASMTRDIEI